MRIYDAHTLRLQGTLDQGGAVTATVFDASGRFLLTAGRDGSARLWRIGNRALMVQFKAGGPVQVALMDGQARTVVTISTSGLVRTFRARDGRLVREFRTHGAAVPKSAALDPAGRFLATVAQDRFARLYSLASGRRVRLLEQNGFVRSVAFSLDGRLILTSACCTSYAAPTAARSRMPGSAATGNTLQPRATTAPSGSGRRRRVTRSALLWDTPTK